MMNKHPHPRFESPDTGLAFNGPSFPGKYKRLIRAEARVMVSFGWG